MNSARSGLCYSGEVTGWRPRQRPSAGPFLPQHRISQLPRVGKARMGFPCRDTRAGFGLGQRTGAELVALGAQAAPEPGDICLRQFRQRSGDGQWLGSATKSRLNPYCVRSAFGEKSPFISSCPATVLGRFKPLSECPLLRPKRTLELLPAITARTAFEWSREVTCHPAAIEAARLWLNALIVDETALHKAWIKGDMVSKNYEGGCWSWITPSSIFNTLPS